jgi:hypothetical protein
MYLTLKGRRFEKRVIPKIKVSGMNNIIRIKI